MEFTFGQSIVNSVSPDDLRRIPWGHKPKQRVAPDAYSVLACLTKYETPQDVWEFAAEYGYEINDRKSLNRVDRICMAVMEEYKDARRLFGDIMEQLREIE